jgi:two-component system CheB/CheR fusion protein
MTHAADDVMQETALKEPTVPGPAKMPAAGAAHSFPVVGIGASAGGLKALSSLLAAIPGDIGMAFVVIQHLDPSHESQLVSLLANASLLPVTEAVDGQEVQPNEVYVIAPNTRLAIERGILRISPREQGPAPHLTIDAFLRSLALDRSGCVIGVILSGTGADGTLGLTAIKAAGGITFVQDDTAEYAGMPQSAIGHGCVDYVLRPSAIAKELVRIGYSGFPCLPPASADIDAGDSEADGPAHAVADALPYAKIMGLLHIETGIDFSHYRATTIMRRTLRRMALVAKVTLAEYADYLAGSAIELSALARDVLIHVTSFFRDQTAFAAVTAVVLPALTQDRTAESPLRLWIAGCSTGQEVYSLAIALLEHLRGISSGLRVQIFATDISDWALARARLGCYPETIVDEVPPVLLARYFTKDASGYRVTKAIRDLCVFAKHDVTSDTPFSRIDFISCRNVLIYLGPVLQKYVLPTFHFSLRAGGFLLLGASESLGSAANFYQTVDDKHRIFRSIAVPGRTRPVPVAQQRSADQGVIAVVPTFVPAVSEMQRAADQIVLGRFAPAGVLLTEALEIIQFRGQTNLFLQPAQGDASLNLLTMVPFAVAESLRAALGEAKLGSLSVRREHVVHRRAHDFREIAFDVIPIKLPTSTTSFLILFEEQEPLAMAAITAQPAITAHAGPTTNHRESRELSQVRTELAAATDYVHSLVEVNQALAERLKDSIEEAQSSTEEFRSTNEELQTTKEEVESTNQELVTINDEMRATNLGLSKASAALRTSAELTSAIVDTIRSPLLVLSATLRVESANQAFLKVFGVNRQETVGQLVYDLGNGQWNIPKLRELLEDILPNHSAFEDFEVVHDFRKIGRKTMLLNARRLHGDEDEARLIVLVLDDVTERRRIANDLQDISRELERSNAELDHFAAVASHDLQEPLRMMTSYLDLLAVRYEAVFDERARGYMTQVTTSAQRLREMIQGILAYSRLGHEATDVEAIDSAIALHNALINLSVKITTTQATISEGVLPRVSANRQQLTQLFQNLVSNGIKFRCPLRSPMIHVAAQERATEWVFSVADNGVGINDGDFARVFQLFQRVHTDKSVRGCGIGLATCKKIVEHHKGRMWIQSKIDLGTTLFFTLPKSNL